jgi:hypothetical protein
MRPCELNSSASRPGVGAVPAAAAAGLGLGNQSSARGSAGGSDFSDGVTGVRFHPVAAPSAAAASSEAQTPGVAGPREAAPTLRRPNRVVVVIDTGGSPSLKSAPSMDDRGFAPVKLHGLAFARAFP